MKKIYLSFPFLIAGLFAMAISCGRPFTVEPTSTLHATPTPTPFTGCLSSGNIPGASYTFFGERTSTLTPVITPIPTATGTVTPVPVATYYPYSSTSACGGTILHNLTEWQSYWIILNKPIPEAPTDFSTQMVFLFPGSYYSGSSLDGICYDDSRIAVYTTSYPVYIAPILCLFCPTTFNTYLIPKSNLLPECYVRYFGYGCITCATPQ